MRVLAAALAAPSLALAELAPAAFSPSICLRTALAPPSSSVGARPAPRRSAAVAPTSPTAITATTDAAGGRDLDSLASDLNSALDICTPSFFKNVRVRVGPSPRGGMHRLGLIAAEDIKPNVAALSVPYDDQIVLSADLAVGTVWKDVLPEGYDGWTGDAGLVAALLLNELAREGGGGGGGGIDLPRRKPEAQALVSAWVRSLPGPSEMGGGGICPHPLLWPEDDQETLQGSSTKKIYRTLDDVDEDSAWLEEKVWSADRDRFPASVELDGEERQCFSPEGFAWAVAVVSSRSVFVDGALRLIPVLDMANHDDSGTEEVTGGTAGAFGTTKCADLRTARGYKAGEEVFASYGPLSAAEYLVGYGFVPPRAKAAAVSELTFELDGEDRFYEDKLDVLEFETYDSAPMDPVQKFDVVYEVGREGEPEPALLQFLRLVKLGEKDAFLLESIFRKEVWGFMSMPVSERNEEDVVDSVIGACKDALADMDSAESDSGAGDSASANDESTPAGLCAAVREAERKALARTMEFMEREKEALDLKEYYQERRLKDLGLDSEWSEDDENSDVGWGQTRAPGSGDLDW